MYPIKKITFFIILFLITIAYACSGDQKQNAVKHENLNKTHLHSDNMTAETKNAIYYTCPMSEHKHIASDKPGKCLECQMDLVAAVESKADSTDYYGCPMESHSHIRTDKPGVCPDCGMDLKPMQLIKIKINY